MRYLIRRRLVALVPTLLTITFLAFALQLVIPGGPAEVLAAQAGGGPDAVQQFQRDLGYDRPVLVRYFDWLSHAVRGDFGYSYRSGGKVWDIIIDRAGASLALVLLATVLATLAGLVAGVIAAVNRRNRFGRILAGSFGLGMSIPNFWLGTLMVGYIAVTLRLLPAGGYHSLADGLGPFTTSMIMPVLVLSLPSSAQIARQVRSAMVQSLESSYVRTARAMGISRRKVVLLHALRNSLTPLIVLLPIVVSSLVGGAVVVEAIFNIPGLGSAIVDAVTNRDFLILQGVVVMLALLVLFLNIASDVLLGIIDPRARSAE